eukprot:6199844-Pleurochrysis_carterae.AAC.4
MLRCAAAGLPPDFLPYSSWCKRIAATIMKLHSMRLLLLLLAATATDAWAPSPTAAQLKAVSRSVSTRSSTSVGPRMIATPPEAEQGVKTAKTSQEKQSLEEEFASVKAAAEVANAFAPSLMGKSPRKRDRILSAIKRVGGWASLGKTLKEEASALVDDSCDVDEPEVCTDKKRHEAAVDALRSLMGKALRSTRGEAGPEELEEEPDMEAGWQSRGKV